MPLPVSVNKNFLNLFDKVASDTCLNSKVDLFVLKFQNKEFNYNALIGELGEIMINYALPRQQYKSLYETKRVYKLNELSKELFRNAESNDGELGELLLFAFLESHLDAPQLLTKLVLKTSTNMYVNGADAVHILKISETSFQLIFGESKMYSSLEDAIYDAFSSIGGLLDNDSRQLQHEISLVNSNLCKETTDESEIKFLKKILIPTENDENLNIDYSFAILLGFDIDQLAIEEANENFKKCVHQRIKSIYDECLPKVQNQLKKKKFRNYNFYIYLLPFTDIENKRKEIIKKLIGS